ncbi:putative mitochondrial protein [Vitis vinifera]|uniref:Putative mitochondrial protein n=1 Tax=Vitis vinifera TaxID=29760 RepID=A0A438C7Q5_VITVI|nr:putative mitochondrial protein [Vitis vinifera]
MDLWVMDRHTTSSATVWQTCLVASHTYGDIPCPGGQRRKTNVSGVLILSSAFNGLKCWDLWFVMETVDHGFYLGKSRPKAARSGRANHSGRFTRRNIEGVSPRTCAICCVFPTNHGNAPADAPTKVTQQSMQRLLKEYEDVFQEPSSLPPAHEVDHCITLKEGTEPINVRRIGKCVFGQQELEYLGHIVTHQGVKVDNNKIATMVAWPHPTNISELRGFLGLTGCIYARTAKWVVKLMGYDYEIIYRLGHENLVADAVSRKSSSPFFSIFMCQWAYAWRNGLLFFKGRVIIPSHAALQTKLLHEMHDTKIGGILGSCGHSRNWPNNSTGQKCTSRCNSISRNVKLARRTTDIHGKDTILVVVDRLSKSAHFLALTHSFTAKIVAERNDPFSGTILPPQIPIYHNGMSSVHEVDQSLEARDELLRQLKINLETSINRMKQQTAFKRAHQKLASRFYRPYPMIQKIGVVAYKLQLPEGAHIHPVFHVSLLKNFVGELAKPSQELPPVNDEGAVILEPQHILDTR